MNVRLLQLADSALPISGYTHSWGLETAVAQKRVHDPETLERWTAQWLKYSLGPLEGVLVASAHRCVCLADARALQALNEVAEASMVPPSIRRASREMGEQLFTLGTTWAWAAPTFQRFGFRDPGGWHHCVTFGFLGAAAAGTPTEVLTAYLHQAALGMIAAGVRCIPVGHTHGQQILAYLHDDLAELVTSLVDRTPTTAGAGCPFYEVLCDEQTRLYARMFRS